MKKIFTIYLLFTYANSFSQDSSLSKPNQIYWKSLSGWRMNGQSLSSKEFKTEIYKVPAAIPVYKKGKRNRVIAFSCLVPMGVCLLLGRQEPNPASSQFGKTKKGFLIVGGLSSGAVIYFSLHSKKQLKEAARIHNENQPLVY